MQTMDSVLNGAETAGGKSRSISANVSRNGARARIASIRRSGTARISILADALRLEGKSSTAQFQRFDSSSSSQKPVASLPKNRRIEAEAARKKSFISSRDTI